MFQPLFRVPFIGVIFRQIIGLLSLSVVVANVLVWVSMMHLIALALLVPSQTVYGWVERSVNFCFSNWVSTNEWWFRTMLGVHWQFDPNMPTTKNTSHLLIANHRSWVDVFLVLAQMNGRLTLPRVFMKSSLRWLPLIGSATYIMGFPQVKRYTKEQLAKRPELAGRDLETTRKACERFKRHPNNLLSFVEGTRFTPVKHAAQASPYHALLKPRAGGIAYVMEVLPNHFDHIVDINITYPQENCAFWDLLTGTLTSATVGVTTVPFPPALLAADFEPAGKDKSQFFDWFNQYWSEKDQRLLAQQGNGCLLESRKNDAINEGPNEKLR